MPPIAPKLQRQRKQRPLPLQSPGDEPSTPAPRATRAECEELFLFLKTRKALGWKHGITRAEVRIGLSKMLNRFVADRRLQAVMAYAPLYGFPLASNSSSGYFIIDTVEDADTCIEELYSRIEEHRLRLKGLEAIRERIKRGDSKEDGRYPGPEKP